MPTVPDPNARRPGSIPMPIPARKPRPAAPEANRGWRKGADPKGATLYHATTVHVDAGYHMRDDVPVCVMFIDSNSRNRQEFQSKCDILDVQWRPAQCGRDGLPFAYEVRGTRAALDTLLSHPVVLQDECHLRVGCVGMPRGGAGAGEFSEAAARRVKADKRAAGDRAGDSERAAYRTTATAGGYGTEAADREATQAELVRLHQRADSLTPAERDRVTVLLKRLCD